jgi:hypothetical protein
MKPEQVLGVIGMANMNIRPGDTSVAQGVMIYQLWVQTKYVHLWKAPVVLR